MTYGVTDNPPWLMTCLYAWQIVISKLSSAATISLMLNDIVCGNSELLSQLMSTTLIMAGLCTFLQSSVGVRLPVFQGPAWLYVIPLLARRDAGWVCPEPSNINLNTENSTALNDTGSGEEEWRRRVLEISGSLIVVSVIHTLIGMCGIVSLLLRFIGPLTIIPALTLIVFEIMKTMLTYAEIHWGIAAVTIVATLLFSSYIGELPIPLPAWTREKGWHMAKYRIMRSFAIILGIFIGWFFAFILTVSGALTDDPKEMQYPARTDSQQSVIDLAHWFYVPYPGQYGLPRFDIGVFFALIAALLTSVLDSVGDYLACAKVCRIPKPPPHATNRGLVVEGICSIFSGAFGACHATTTYSGLIGMLTLTGVASRVVFTVTGVYLMLLGVLGKVAAFFVTIPKPVIAGSTFVLISSLMGMCVSVLEDVDMSQSRNIMTFGFAVVMGKSIPDWIIANKDRVNTGNDLVNQLIFALAGNPMFMGGFIGCILDNSLPGKAAATKQGVKEGETDEDAEDEALEKIQSEIYDPPFVGKKLRKWRWAKFVPIFPGFRFRCRRKICCKEN